LKREAKKMLKVMIPTIELFDETKNEFVYVKEQALQLEHSLVSLSKWESKWCKPFLTKNEKTIEETIDYIKCMTTTQNVDEKVYDYLPNDVLSQVHDYINAPMTATTFGPEENRKNREIITAEIIYYWMIALNIPFECQKWHLNRLLTLIQVCNIKNAPPKKMSQKQIMSRNTAVNAARRQALHTEG
jgi:hypothetical protein